jgi:hypothetical protein
MKSLLPIFLLFIVSSCSFGEKETVNKQVEVAEAPTTFISYELKKIVRKKGPCVSDSTNVGCLDVKINYPILSAGPFQNVINNINKRIKEDIFEYAFINEKPESFESLITEITEGYEDVLATYKNYSTEWSLEISSDIIYQSAKFISLATSIYSYTGGAHPNSYLVYKTYDLKTGNRVLLDDLLVEGFEDKLNPAAEIEFRMNHEILPSIKLSDAGYFFEEDKFILNDNFAVMDGSLLFYFNPYEITSYAQGPEELQIGFSDYKALIKPGSLLDGRE